MATTAPQVCSFPFRSNAILQSNLQENRVHRDRLVSEVLQDRQGIREKRRMVWMKLGFSEGNPYSLKVRSGKDLQATQDRQDRLEPLECRACREEME